MTRGWKPWKGCATHGTEGGFRLVKNGDSNKRVCVLCVKLRRPQGKTPDGACVRCGGREFTHVSHSKSGYAYDRCRWCDNERSIRRQRAVGRIGQPDAFVAIEEQDDPDGDVAFALEAALGRPVTIAVRKDDEADLNLELVDILTGRA